jgi:hypothetical protein
VLDFGANFQDGPRAFVPDHPGELDDLRPDASGAEVVKVGAADPHRFDAEQDVARVVKPRLGGFPDFEPPEVGQKRSLHGNSSAPV